MASSPKFLQGVFPFNGTGLDKRELIDESMVYIVPAGVIAQPLYLRGGNSSDELIVVTLLRDGQPMRLFPVGARASVNVPLRVVEDVDPDTRLELTIAAPAGTTGDVVIDFGLMEV
ncbi:MAG: molybdopterin oxidoreductase [Mycobacteriaceae bacterium]|nr:molybdopterin oxidoreductase [Mycobacteriaceae bacterium]